VPTDLQSLVGKREIRYSLKTGSVGIAKSKARLLAGQIQALFRILRKRRTLILQNLSDERIRGLVQKYLDQYKKGLEDRNLSGDPPFMNEEDFYEYVGGLDDIKADKIAELGIGDYRFVEDVVDGILKEEGIEGIQKGSQDYIKICRGILRAQVKGIEYEKKFMLEELPDEPAPVPMPTPQPNPIPLPAPSPEVPSISLKELIDRYWKFKTKSGKWSDSTQKEYQNGYRVISDFLGADTPVRKIGYPDLQDFFDMLMKLPPNFTRSKQYEGMTFRDVLKSDLKGGLSVMPDGI
jgi:hypothetical protein